MLNPKYEIEYKRDLQYVSVFSGNDPDIQGSF
jgi:hypothetical protein